MNSSSLFKLPTLPNGDRLVEALRGKGWVKSKALARQLGVPERTIREEAEHSEGRVISSQEGYRLTEEASMEDVHHSIAALESRRRKLSIRIHQTQQFAHKRLHKAA